MTANPRLALVSTVLDTPDPAGLARFYARLLGWRVRTDEPEWVTLRPPGGGRGLSFQRESAYARPVWPARPGDQQMMSHLDIAVDDLDGALAHAIVCGASLAPFQPQDDVRVCLDPDGHPFCLFVEEPWPQDLQ
jgi:catechol 2,3-dioxygenase-like lactoylglutathione lyase family enzyme